MNDETKSFLHQLYVLIEAAGYLVADLGGFQDRLESLMQTRVVEAMEDARQALLAIRDDLETDRPHGLAGMSTIQLIAELVGRGIELTAYGDSLVMDYPPHSLSEFDWAALTERKAEIMAYLFRGGGPEAKNSSDLSTAWSPASGLAATTRRDLGQNRFTFYIDKES